MNTRDVDEQELFNFIKKQGSFPARGKKFIKLANLNKLYYKDPGGTYRTLLIRREFIRLTKILNKLRVRALLFKHPDIIRGSDIDILIKPEDRKKLLNEYRTLGYRERSVPPKEINLSPPDFRVPILDIHTLIAYPHSGELNDNRLKDAHAITADAWYFVKVKKRFGLFHSTDEFYLVSSVFRFWYNDWGFGMQRLYDIITFVQKKQSTLDMRLISQLLQQYHLNHVFSFIIRLGFGYYSIKIPDRIRPLLQSNRASFVLPHMRLRLIVARYTFKMWNKQSPPVRSLYREIAITDLFLDPRTSIARFFRPRIGVFAYHCIIRIITGLYE